MSKESRICEHCGTKLIKYSILLDRAISGFLFKLYGAGGEARVKDLGLTNVEYSKYSKSAYWYLAEPVKGEEGDSPRGIWRLTEKGIKFIEGLISVPKYAITFQKEVVGFSDEVIMFSDANDPCETKPDYQRQIAEQLGG